MATTSPPPSLSNPSSTTLDPPIQSPTGPIASPTFNFPTYTTFPPFYTLQPNLTTRARQLELWSSLILAYCAHHRLFRLSLSTPPPSLFHSPALPRALKPADIRAVLDYMSNAQNGARVEWLPAATKGAQRSESCYVYWRTLAEWAEQLYAWVEETGQKGAVLTVYELREGEAVRATEWRGMDEGFLRKVVGVLVKRGKAQIFGLEESAGIKFF